MRQFVNGFKTKKSLSSSLLMLNEEAAGARVLSLQYTENCCLRLHMAILFSKNTTFQKLPRTSGVPLPCYLQGVVLQMDDAFHVCSVLRKVSGCLTAHICRGRMLFPSFSANSCQYGRVYFWPRIHVTTEMCLKCRILDISNRLTGVVLGYRKIAVEMPLASHF